MFTAALAAEWVKLTSTRAALWALGAVAVLGLGTAALVGTTAYGIMPMAPAKAAGGVATFGVPVLMVLASMTVTAEYRTQLIRTTFLAIPDRTVVLCAKAVLAAWFAAVCAGLTAFGAVLLARMTAPQLVAAGLSPTAPGTWRTIGAIGLYAAAAAVLAVAVGALLRSAAAAVAVLLLWPLVVEVVLGVVPETGPRIGPYLPFANAASFTGVHWLPLGYDMRWGPVGGFLYFCAAVAVAFAAAAAVLNRRDA